VQLHEEGLQSNTLAGYRTAIGSIHTGFEDGSIIANNQTIHRVIRGSFTLRPPPKRLVPQWSLILVLNHLAGAPYEPLHKASLMDTTMKCAFLMALTAGRRSSQVTALSTNPNHMVWTRSGVKLTTALGFLAKNETRDYTVKPISLVEMKKLSDTTEDKVWCPVRTLKYYLDKTKSLRHTEQLFIKTIEPHDGVKPSTFAAWVVKTIKAAYPPGTAPGSVRAHDVRGVSASWARFNHAKLKDVIEAAAWKTPNTFISCYVKDIDQAEANYGATIIKAAAKAARKRSDH
jgi:hypothetical protein